MHNTPQRTAPYTHQQRRFQAGIAKKLKEVEVDKDDKVCACVCTCACVLVCHGSGRLQPVVEQCLRRMYALILQHAHVSCAELYLLCPAC
jgi:hypothetical protein